MESCTFQAAITLVVGVLLTVAGIYQFQGWM